MLKVYGILLTQLIITFGLILITQINIIKNYLLDNYKLSLVLFFSSVFIYIIAYIIFSVNPKIIVIVPTNYIFLFIITICSSIMLIYVSIAFSFECIIGVISFVLAISFSIFATSFFNKIDIEYLYLFIISFGHIIIVYGLLAIFFRSYYLLFLFCFLGSIPFALYIVYDTIYIRDHFSYDDYILAAMTLYFDIIRLFIKILELLARLAGKKKNNF